MMYSVKSTYSVPSPSSEIVTVPILSPSFHQLLLMCCHNPISVGHLGSERTLERLHQEAYWIGIARDVEQYCQECSTCQKVTPPMPQ